MSYKVIVLDSDALMTLETTLNELEAGGYVIDEVIQPCATLYTPRPAVLILRTLTPVSIGYEVRPPRSEHEEFTS